MGTFTLARYVPKLADAIMKYPEMCDMTESGFARYIGISPPTVASLRDRGLIPKNGKRLIDPLVVLTRWKNHCDEPLNEGVELGPPVVTPKEDEPIKMAYVEHNGGYKYVGPYPAENIQPPVIRRREDLGFEAARDKAVKSAREAYRDTILEAADDAEKRGDLKLQNRLLKDFIQAEESFKVHFR